MKNYLAVVTTSNGVATTYLLEQADVFIDRMAKHATFTVYEYLSTEATIAGVKLAKAHVRDGIVFFDGDNATGYIRPILHGTDDEKQLKEIEAIMEN